MFRCSKVHSSLFDFHLSVFSTEDNARNDYPYEMSGDAADLNGIRTINSSHLLVVFICWCPQLKIIQEMFIQMRFLMRKRLRKSKRKVKLLMNQKAKVRMAVVFLLMVL